MNKPILESEQYYGEVSEILKKELKNKPTIYRLTGKDRRIYFTKEGDLPIQVYNSGTTIIDNFKDKDGDEFIHKWKVGLINSGQNPNSVLKERQVFGTLLHILYSNVLLKEVVSFLSMYA